MNRSVKELQIDDEYEIITENETIEQAAIKLKDNNVSFLVVVGNENLKVPLGVISDRLIIEEIVAKGLHGKDVLVKEFMKETIIVRETDTVEHCLDKFSSTAIPALPVVDYNSSLIGVVTLTDCLGAGTVFDLSDEHLE